MCAIYILLWGCIFFPYVVNTIMSFDSVHIVWWVYGWCIIHTKIFACICVIFLIVLSLSNQYEYWYVFVYVQTGNMTNIIIVKKCVFSINPNRLHFFQCQHSIVLLNEYYVRYTSCIFRHLVYIKYMHTVCIHLFNHVHWTCTFLFFPLCTCIHFFLLVYCLHLHWTLFSLCTFCLLVYGTTIAVHAICGGEIWFCFISPQFLSLLSVLFHTHKLIGCVDHHPLLVKMWREKNRLWSVLTSAPLSCHLRQSRSDVLLLVEQRAQTYVVQTVD